MPSPPGHPALRAEAQLLLLTAALVPPADRLRALLRSPLDWNLLVTLAAQQRALPHLWRQLGEVDPQSVPDAVREEVRAPVMVADFTQELLRERLGSTVRALDAVGIRVMALKGAALALTRYPRFTDRPMGDIDLLVDREVADTALTTAEGLGWERAFDEDFDGFYSDHHHLPPLRIPGSQARLELHTELYSPGHPFDLPLDRLWAGAQTVRLAGATVRIPAPLDSMIHLCTHFLWSHGGGSGAWRTFRDVDVLLRTSSFQADELTRRAADARAGTCVYWTLRLARRVSDVAVPAEVLDDLRPKGSDFVLDRLEHHLVTGLLPGGRSCPSMTVSRLMWEAAVRPRSSGHGRARPWSRAEVVRQTFLPPNPESLPRRALHQVQGLGAWGRYIGALFRSAPAAAYR